MAKRDTRRGAQERHLGFVSGCAKMPTVPIKVETSTNPSRLDEFIVNEWRWRRREREREK